MDSPTHALLAFLGGKVFKRSRVECAALLLGGIAPDFDIFLIFMSGFVQTTLPLYHRGITHTLIFGFVTAAIVLFIASRKYFHDLLARVFRTNIRLLMQPSLLAFAYIGVLSHLFLDALTTRGVMLFYPFSVDRFSAELFFYVDPYLTAISFALTGYAVLVRRRMISAAGKTAGVQLEDTSPTMQGTYVKMFAILALALILFSGLRIYEKGVSADYFGTTAANVFPTLSPFEWRVVDTAAGKIYDFDSLDKTIISESNFSGTKSPYRRGLE